jgi:hypothetical protein
MKNSDIDKCIEFLKDNNLLEYGTLIPKEVFESLFQTDCAQDWSFLGPLLELREALVERGYLCTQRGIEFGCIKIYDVDEMLQHSDKLFKNAGQRIKKLQKCLQSTKSQEFSDRDFRRHQLMSTKVNAGLHAMKSVLSSL